MKKKINLFLMIVCFGLISINPSVGQTNSQYDYFENLVESKSFKELAVFLKNGLRQDDIQSDYSILSLKYNSLLRINSNYVLSEEIREITPPWGDPSKEKSEFSYNGKGNNNQIQRFAWENSVWVLKGRGNLTYDEFDREIELLNQTWVNPNWEDWFKQTTSYNSDGQVLEVVGYFYTNGIWTTSWRETNTYDENGQLVNRLFEWANGSVWSPSSQSDFSYDANGLLVEEIYQYYDNGSWLNGEMYIYSYDAAENNIGILTKIWNETVWEDYYRQELTYDNQNQLTNILGYLLEGSVWRNNTRWTYSYDENQNNDEYLFEQNWDGSGFQLFEKTTRKFIDLLTDVEDVDSNQPVTFILNQNYPNPFNPSTKIKYSIPKESNVTLRVFDVLGSEIATIVNEEQSQGNYEVQFNGIELTSGIYFYRLQAGDFVETNKMILMK